MNDTKDQCTSRAGTQAVLWACPGTGLQPQGSMLTRGDWMHPSLPIQATLGDSDSILVTYKYDKALQAGSAMEANQASTAGGIQGSTPEQGIA